MGRLSRFQWYKGAAWDAVAQYEDGWALFFWSGLLQGERHLNELFSRMGVDLMEHRAVGPVPWPGRMCFVVSDLWQRELVYRAARRRGCGDQVETFACRTARCPRRPTRKPVAAGWRIQLLGVRRQLALGKTGCEFPLVLRRWQTAIPPSDCGS